MEFKNKIAEKLIVRGKDMMAKKKCDVVAQSEFSNFETAFAHRNELNARASLFFGFSFCGRNFQIKLMTNRNSNVCMCVFFSYSRATKMEWNKKKKKKKKEFD